VVLILVFVGIRVARDRTEFVRIGTRIGRLHARQLELTHQIWEQQMELARLGSPSMVQDRLLQLERTDDPGIVSRTAAATVR
jgi:hypothetical protein